MWSFNTLLLLIKPFTNPVPGVVVTCPEMAIALSSAGLLFSVSWSLISHLILCSVCLFVSNLLHLALNSPGSSILLLMAGFPSFLRLNNIPLCVCVLV